MNYVIREWVKEVKSNGDIWAPGRLILNGKYSTLGFLMRVAIKSKVGFKTGVSIREEVDGFRAAGWMYYYVIPDVVKNWARLPFYHGFEDRFLDLEKNMTHSDAVQYLESKL